MSSINKGKKGNFC